MLRVKKIVSMAIIIVCFLKLLGYFYLFTSLGVFTLAKDSGMTLEMLEKTFVRLGKVYIHTSTPPKQNKKNTQKTSH